MELDHQLTNHTLPVSQIQLYQFIIPHCFCTVTTKVKPCARDFHPSVVKIFTLWPFRGSRTISELGDLNSEV